VLRLTTGTAGDNTTIHRLTGNNTLSGTIQVWRGALEIDNPASAGNARVVLEANVSPQGDLRFSESMTFANDIRLAWTGNVIGVADPAHKVTLSGNIDESGGVRPLTKAGAGILEITGNATYTGATTVTAGTLLINGSLGSTATTTVNPGATIGGNASFSGALAVNGALSPGNSPGQIDMNGADLSMGIDSTALFELGGTTRGTGSGNYDSIIDIGTLTLDGLWTITLTNGFMPAANDMFDLFDAATVDATGFDVSTDLILPALDGGLTWDTSGFTTSGQLGVIPEPSTALLGGLGLLALLRRRR
jgi:autotransporter-associated beta strand protein